MTDATTPTPPAAATPAAPAPAPAAAEKPAETPAAPVDASTAGKALRSFADLKKAAREKEADKAAGRGKPPEAKPAAEPAKPAEETKPDPDMAAVERILAEDARVKAETKKLKAEREALEAERKADEKERNEARALREARAKGDVLGMFRALGFTEKELFQGDDAIIVKLADARTNLPELTEAQRVQAVIDAKMAEREAEEKKAEDARKATEDAEKLRLKQEADANFATVKAAYAAIADRLFEAGGKDKYPALVKAAAKGAVNPSSAATEYALRNRSHTLAEAVKRGDANPQGQMLTEEEALADLEEYWSDLLKPDAPPAPEPKPAVEAHRPLSISPAAQRQEGTPARALPPGASLNDKWAAFKERARAAAQK